LIKRIFAIGFVFCCTSLAWFVLGATVEFRTHRQDKKLKNAVGQLWGTPQTQQAPEVYWAENIASPSAEETEILEEKRYLPLAASRIDVDLQLAHRRKGLLWYAVYRVGFAAAYQVVNDTDQPRELIFDFLLPAPGAVYDGFKLTVGDQELPLPEIVSGHLRQPLHLLPGQRESIQISYQSQGLDEWRYSFGDHVRQIADFSLTMRTDFDQIDFPQQTISPVLEEETPAGWKLVWQYDTLLAGADLGMDLPRRLNPGPWVRQVCLAAPVSLFLFFFLLFVFSTMKEIRLHPMHYFFIGAAFFSFHLLLAYLVDHVSILAAFLICSLVSLFLVVSYMRLVVGTRFAFIQVGIAQLVYQVLFSCTFFFAGYTGLAITILCIITLFGVMQFTGRVDWEAVFRQDDPVPPAG